MSENKVTMKQTKTTTKASENSSSVPEFIQKLFRMLENTAFRDTFCWNDNGTTFIVKDTNEFSRTILPKHFKHCNFASFVRQLNKYDFHKVRNGDDGHKPYGEQAWEFVHPKFMRERRDLLEDIKRKAPGNKQKKDESLNNVPQDIVKQADGTPPTANSIQEIRNIGANLQAQIDQLKKSRFAMEDKINRLKQTDNHIINELCEFSKNMVAKDDIIKRFLKSVAEKDLSSAPQAQRLLDSYSRIADSNKEQISNLNNHLGILPIKLESETLYQPEALPMHKSIMNLQQQAQLPSQPPPPPLPAPTSTDAEVASAAAAAASMNAGSLIGSPLKTADGLTFVTLGRLSSNMSVRDNRPAIEIMAADQTPTLGTSLQRPSGIKRKTPPAASATPSLASSSQVSWTVPPRILLVDDDSVYRDLSGKLLQVIGCTIDLAQDGVEALKKMGLEKYDLILMDIVMPKMDGISATRSIRQYDPLTPIISMTSNFTDNDIMQYIGSGMTDILPKPFSKRTLYQMLEKYCAHLKAIQRVQGLDPTSSASIPQALGANALPMANGTVKEEPSTSSSSTSSPSQPQQQQQPTSAYSSVPSSTNSSTPSSTQSAFPLGAYPYPVTMNSVPTEISNGEYNNITNNDIPNVTFWPQQQPQQQDPPPAIIPNEGKFTWAVPASTMNQPAQQVFDPVAVVLNESHKRSRTGPSPSQSQAQ